MRSAWIVARLTFLEIRRDRVLAIIGGLALLSMGLSYLFTFLALGQGRRIIIDFGFGLGTLLGVALVIFVGTTLLHRESAGGSLDLILARPVGRGAFLVGKFLGLSAIVAIWTAAITIMIAAMLGLEGEAPGAGLWPAALLLWTKLEILAALGLLLGTLSSPVLAGFLILGFALAGHTAGDLEGLIPLLSPAALTHAVEAMLLLLPRFDLYGAALPMALGDAVDRSVLVWGLSYGALYTLAVLVLAAWRLQRTDLNAGA
ncbi:MAG: ABC transporter permease subunit [Candidatus Eisenbacteria bacterium]|nr:ABC transporter permease subunit [Candidatus Eisenbacteria bacterium]